MPGTQISKAMAAAALSGTEGGHDIHLRELGRRGMHLYVRTENVDDGDVTFSDGLPERLATVESSFNQRMRKAIDAYIAATGINAEEQPPTPEDHWLPSEPARLNSPRRTSRQSSGPPDTNSTRPSSTSSRWTNGAIQRTRRASAKGPVYAR
ncbi:hypothetical protein J2Y41_001332 [Arthrobacter sp. 1088]|uniref:hypothetical protein n=1 Tax=Arthrobacter sp. 1088 TaxID=2817768 RepID=UPI0028667A54|nr:hypothetical protein [Arthrobacter sp. 1088]MDR6685777.1 hypothetical protein [Arthrobacter sp. 1088]